MKRERRLGLAVLVFLVAPFSISAWGAVIVVPKQYPTIQAAIDAAVAGDEIIVSRGIYYENIRFKGKNIILRSANEELRAAILDGGQNGSVVIFSGTETAKCVLSGFVIRNGKSEYGAGILGFGCQATIQNNTIEGNTARGSYRYEEFKRGFWRWMGYGGAGGGICDCDGTIQDNMIHSNLVTATVTIAPYGSSDTASSLAVLEGEPYIYGGGLSNCDGLIQRNYIYNNHAELPGYHAFGHGMDHCRGTIMNNITFGNGDDNWDFGVAAGIEGCSGIVLNNTFEDTLRYCDGPIVNCIVGDNWSSTPLNLVNCVHVDRGSKDLIGLAPSFRLLPGSPCIDAGTDQLQMRKDIDGDPRPVGGKWDIGADEFFPKTESSDVFRFASQWQNGESGMFLDFTGDGSINRDDLLWLVKKR